MTMTVLRLRSTPRFCAMHQSDSKAIDQVYKQEDCAKISRFINQVNQVILEALHQAVKELKNRKVGLLESKYHSLYILAGMIFSRYDINVENLTVTQTEENTKIYKSALI